MVTVGAIQTLDFAPPANAERFEPGAGDVVGLRESQTTLCANPLRLSQVMALPDFTVTGLLKLMLNVGIVTVCGGAGIGVGKGVAEGRGVGVGLDTGVAVGNGVGVDAGGGFPPEIKVGAPEPLPQAGMTRAVAPVNNPIIRVIIVERGFLSLSKRFIFKMPFHAAFFYRRAIFIPSLA